MPSACCTRRVQTLAFSANASGEWPNLEVGDTLGVRSPLFVAPKRGLSRGRSTTRSGLVGLNSWHSKTFSANQELSSVLYFDGH